MKLLLSTAALTAVAAPALAQDEALYEIEAGEPTAQPAMIAETPVGTLPGEAPPRVEDDGERGPVEVDWAVRSSAAVHRVENVDLRPYDGTSDETVRDTDDRSLFGYADVGADLTVRPAAPVFLDASVEVETQWPTFVLAGSPSAALNVYGLALGVDIVDAEAVKLTASLGRQPFSIGGVPVDYIFSATTDSAVVALDLQRFGRLRLLAIDLVSGQDLPAAGFLRYEAGSEPRFNFQGESTTLRTGGVYEVDQDALPFGLTAAAYYFYASVGGASNLGTGADISYGGQLGNFRDADYQHLFGARVGYEHQLDGDGDEETDEGGAVAVWAEFARSMGIDRKELVADHDVETNGNAFGGGASLTLPAGITELTASAAFYRFDGGAYDSNGMQFESGFVGFRGARVGGLALGRHAAWRPSATLAPDGIDHSPHRQSRAAGTQFVTGSLGLSVLDTALRVDAWFLTDTGSTFVDPDNLAGVRDPPFGYSREEFAAQERLGRVLGTEIDVTLSQRFADMLEIYAQWGGFFPGAFYDVEVDRIVEGDETALGGSATLTAIAVGIGLEF